jgi:hypothetical protein
VRPAPIEAKGRMIMSAKSVEIIPASETEVLIPLNKLNMRGNLAKMSAIIIVTNAVEIIVSSRPPERILFGSQSQQAKETCASSRP